MTLVAEKPKRTPKREELAEFGYVLDELMARYRIRSRTSLSKLLGEADYPVSQPMISYYMLGDYEIPARFVVKTIQVMEERHGAPIAGEDRSRLLKAWWESKPPEERAAIEEIYGSAGGPEVTAEDLEDAVDAEARREERHEEE
jgi:hypothetical protein